MSYLLLLWSCAAPEELPVVKDPESMAHESVDWSEEDRQALYQRAAKDLEEQGVDTIQWGLTPYATPAEVLSQYGPILDFIQEELSLSFSVVVAESL